MSRRLIKRRISSGVGPANLGTDREAKKLPYRPERDAVWPWLMEGRRILGRGPESAGVLRSHHDPAAWPSATPAPPGGARDGGGSPRSSASFPRQRPRGSCASAISCSSSTRTAERQSG